MGRLYRLFAAIATFAILAAPTVAQAEDVLKLAIPHKGLWDTAVADYGQRMGFFAQEGLKLDLLYTAGGSEIEQAVMSGYHRPRLGRRAARRARSLWERRAADSHLGRNDRFARYLLVRARRQPDQEPQGRRRQDHGLFLARCLEQLGRPFCSSSRAGTPIKLTPTGDIPGTLTQVMSGQIDIGHSAVPFVFDQIDAGKIRIVARGSDLPEVANQTVRVNFALADTVKNKRDQLVRFMHAYQRTIDWMYSDPKAVQWLADDAHVTVDDAHRVPNEFIPKTALRLAPVGELDLSIKQAIDTKRLTGPLTKEQITKLIDIVYTPPQN